MAAMNERRGWQLLLLLHWSFGFIEIWPLTPSTRSKTHKKNYFGFTHPPLKFISAPRKDKHFIDQLWQLLTASNVSAWTQAWQAKWAVFKIEGFVSKRFLPFFPNPSPLFYLRHFSRGLWLLFLILCSKTEQKRLLRRLHSKTLSTPHNGETNRGRPR